MGENKPKKKILIDKPDITQTNAIQEELICFHNCIIEHKQSPVPIDDGVAVLFINGKPTSVCSSSKNRNAYFIDDNNNRIVLNDHIKKNE